MKTDEQYDEMVQIFIKAIDTITKHNSNLQSRLSRKFRDQARPRDEHGHFVTNKGGVKFIHSKPKKPTNAAELAAYKNVRGIKT